jgi:hypothetical protein
MFDSHRLHYCSVPVKRDPTSCVRKLLGKFDLTDRAWLQPGKVRLRFLPRMNRNRRGALASIERTRR